MSKLQGEADVEVKASDDLLEEDRPDAKEKPKESNPQDNKDDDDDEFRAGQILLTIFAIIFVIVTLPLSIFCLFSTANEYERAVIFRFGRIRKGGPRGPGLYFTMPCIDDTTTVDLRTKNFNIPPQSVLTKDSLSVTVDAVIYYRVFDPIYAVVNVENYDNSTRLLAQTALRNALGTKDLAGILAERENISRTVQSTLAETTKSWGVKVERVEIKDVRLPDHMQRAMAAEAEASREARAQLIAAEGELRASRTLKEAAEIMSEAPQSLQLRYLQTLQTISAERNSTIIFPIPLDMFQRGSTNQNSEEASNSNQCNTQ